MSDTSKKNFIWFWVAVIFILLIIIIYVATLGKVNIGGNVSAPNEFKDNKEEAIRRHARLNAFIEKQEKVALKLSKRFKRIYFAVRFSFVLLWAGYMFLLFKLGWIQNLGNALNFSEAAILVCIAFNFLTFGSLSNLNSFINLIKLKLENWIWGKHINISDSIEANKVELKQFEVSKA